MARKPQVTRTFITTHVNVLCLDVNTAEPFNKDVLLPRTYKDEAKLFKAVQAVVDNETVKAVHIVFSEEVEVLRGMSEQYFLDHSIVLDPETRKPIGDADGTTEADEDEETETDAE